MVPQTLKADSATKYLAASLHINGGPDIASDSYHGWLLPPILVDEDGRILDPQAFGDSGLVQVTGVASRLWTAYGPDGRTLDYEPSLKEIDWVNGVIKVRIATDSNGHRIRLNVVRTPTAAATQPAASRYFDQVVH